MHKRLIGFAAAVAAVGAVGCSSSGNTYTCDFGASAGLCYTWTSSEELNSTQVSQLQTACTGGGGGGTFTTGGSCPSTNRVGSCTFSNFGVSGVSYVWSLYSPAYDAATGQSFCTNGGGTWTAG